MSSKPIEDPFPSFVFTRHANTYPHGFLILKLHDLSSSNPLTFPHRDRATSHFDTMTSKFATVYHLAPNLMSPHTATTVCEAGTPDQSNSCSAASHTSSPESQTAQSESIPSSAASSSCSSPARSPAPQSSSQQPFWVLATQLAAQRDSRRQPWKETFGDSVDSGFDDGEDLVRVEKSRGGKFDPECPFRTQGSSLAA